ncbi:MAG: zinc metallopeptidase [Firmicutes bacterium]|nr:zinc metallopeptidase [Bacillota bacterium]MBR3053253.1 zinc metallopeptidase [Bacillota bacterium]
MYYDISFFLLIPAMIFAIAASAGVRSTFNRYAQIPDSMGYTGAQAARRILDANGLTDVPIEQVAGNLSDHYDPRTRTVRLSQSVYGSNSISAVAVACHETGHAMQHASGYAPLNIRSMLVPVANAASSFTWILIMIGIMVMASGNSAGSLFFDIGVAVFLIVVAFHVVTLPVEFNASSRTLEQMRSLNIVVGEENDAAKKVLTAAAWTYVAGLAVAVANLLRLISIRGSRR